jgi:uncharacterized membrane-anchored protein YitT (DUF2179 family)
MVKKHPALRGKLRCKMRVIRRIMLIVLGAAVMAFDIKIFINAAGLVPGGITGIALLIKDLGVPIPFSVLLISLNAVPAVICFIYVGKKFTLYSILMVILSGVMTDFMPWSFNDFILQLNNPLLCAIFGGILNGFAILLCLSADACSGGAEFIAIFISEKYRRDAWNYIFVGNCIILIIAGTLLSLNAALYSIIFQFTTTVFLNSLYRAYQQKTLLIITTRPTDVYNLIQERTQHAATSMSGMGLYQNQERSLLYSVVFSNEVSSLVNAIRAIDTDAFINVIKTEQINGKFYKKPID